MPGVIAGHRHVVGLAPCRSTGPGSPRSTWVISVPVIVVAASRVDAGGAAADPAADDLRVRAGGPHAGVADTVDHQVAQHHVGGAREHHDAVLAAGDVQRWWR